jgi:ribosome-binding factor A
MNNKLGRTVSQRQLRVGEMIKQSLGMIFVRNEAKVPELDTNTITVTEVKMSQDLKIAKAYVLPLGGKNAEETVEKLKKYSFLIRKTLSKKIIMKFLPKILFAKDDSFEYAEKIENLIKQATK